MRKFIDCYFGCVVTVYWNCFIDVIGEFPGLHPHRNIICMHAEALAVAQGYAVCVLTHRGTGQGF